VQRQNHAHQHSSSRFVTPEDRHTGPKPRSSRDARYGPGLLFVGGGIDFFKKDGNKCARNVQIANRLSGATAITGTITGLAGWAPGYALARGALTLGAPATAFDTMWKYLVDGGTNGEGIVSLQSRRALQGKTAEVRITSGPTHQQVTRLLAAKRLMEGQLRFRFNAAINGVPIP